MMIKKYLCFLFWAEETFGRCGFMRYLQEYFKENIYNPKFMDVVLNFNSFF